MIEWKVKHKTRFLLQVEICKHGIRCKECCWLWQGTRYGNGYGCFHIEGSGSNGTSLQLGAHICMYQFKYGRIKNRKSKRLEVCHTCDNPLCCNFYHLFVGTRKQNVQDMIEKGRGIIGEVNPNARLNEFDVKEVFTLRQSGMLLREIADKKCISVSHVCNILKSKKWGHIGRSAQT